MIDDYTKETTDACAECGGHEWRSQYDTRCHECIEKAADIAAWNHAYDVAAELDDILYRQSRHLTDRMMMLALQDDAGVNEYWHTFDAQKVAYHYLCHITARPLEQRALLPTINEEYFK